MGSEPAGCVTVHFHSEKLSGSLIISAFPLRRMVLKGIV